MLTLYVLFQAPARLTMTPANSGNDTKCWWSEAKSSYSRCVQISCPVSVYKETSNHRRILPCCNGQRRQEWQNQATTRTYLIRWRRFGIRAGLLVYECMDSMANKKKLLRMLRKSNPVRQESASLWPNVVTGNLHLFNILNNFDILYIQGVLYL